VYSCWLGELRSGPFKMQVCCVIVCPRELLASSIRCEYVTLVNATVDEAEIAISPS
jgi:hypothetical protein